MARNHYTAEYKTKLVLEVLLEERSLNEIASKNNLHPNIYAPRRRPKNRRSS